jgi:hypothetical protein
MQNQVGRFFCDAIQNLIGTSSLPFQTGVKSGTCQDGDISCYCGKIIIKKSHKKSSQKIIILT